MRVVFVTHNYPRFAGDIPGAFLHPLAVALAGEGVDVRVVAPSDAGQGGRELLDGIPVRRVRYGTAAAETLAYRGTMASAITSPAGLLGFDRLRRALRWGADEELRGGGRAVVHAHWWIPGGMAAPSTVPMVLTMHGTDVRLAERHAAARWMARRVVRRAAVVTTVSRALADSIARYLGRVVAPEAIQPMPLVPLDRPLSRGGGGVIVVGRLTAQKRVDLAIEAVALLAATRPALRLTIAGDGPEGAALRDLVGARSIANTVSFLGAVPPEGVPPLLATADCCVMPARDEGFGLAAAEALIQGVPVVACEDGGGVRDVLAGGGGVLVPADPRELAAAIGTVLDDPAARAAAQRGGEAWRARLDPHHVATCCLDWYRQALDA